jgi:hypothetical protein
MPASASRVLLSLAIAGVVAVGATACGTEAEPRPTGTATGSATPEPSDSPSEEPGAVGTPLTIDCEQLISPQAMYDYNPNFSLNNGFEPADGTAAAEIASLNGVTCAWVNQTSGATIEVAVAQLPEAELASIKTRVTAESESAPAFAAEGFFRMAGTVGEADAFSGEYWVSATSADFYEAGDAEPIVAAAVAALG